MAKTYDDHAQEAALRIYTASSGQITNFNKNGVITSIIEVVARFFDEITYQAELAIRSIFLSTAKGERLSTLGEQRYGIPRLGPRRGGVVLTFTGTAGSTIPANTEITTDNEDVIYLTINEATIPAGGHERVRVDALAQEPGIIGRVGPYRLNKFVASAPSGVTSVTNATSSINADEQESDAEYRTRILESHNTFAQLTKDFFVSVAREANDEVVRAVARFTGQGALTVYVTRRNGTDFTSGELDAIADYIAARMKASTQTTLAVENIVWADIEIEITGTLINGVSKQTAIRAVADRLDDYINPTLWAPGKNVDSTSLLSEIVQTGVFGNIVENTFEPSSDVAVGSYSLPRVVSISITDSAGDTLQEDHSTYVSY